MGYFSPSRLFLSVLYFSPSICSDETSDQTKGKTLSNFTLLIVYLFVRFLHVRSISIHCRGQILLVYIIWLGKKEPFFSNRELLYMRKHWTINTSLAQAHIDIIGTSLLFLFNSKYPHLSGNSAKKYIAFDSFFVPRHKKLSVLFYTLRTVWVSVGLSVGASFPDSYLSSLWPIFFKLCMDFDIGEEWFGIANVPNLFSNNRVMALIDVKKSFPQYIQNKWMKFDKSLSIHWYIQDPFCI